MSMALLGGYQYQVIQLYIYIYISHHFINIYQYINISIYIYISHGHLELIIAIILNHIVFILILIGCLLVCQFAQHVMIISSHVVPYFLCNRLTSNILYVQPNSVYCVQFVMILGSCYFKKKKGLRQINVDLIKHCHVAYDLKSNNTSK